MININHIVKHLYPRALRKHYKDMLFYANFKVDHVKFISTVILNTFFLSIFLGFSFAKYIPFPLYYVMPVYFISFQILAYVLITLSADKSSQFIDDVLPDALQLMSTNLRAGMTVDKALLLSARPEFGPLKDQLNYVGKEITLGMDIKDALNCLKDRVNSKNLDQSINLIVTGLMSGGELSELLDRTAKDLRKQRIIQRKIGTSVNMYFIFISAAIAFGSPLLFGLSSVLIEVVKSVFESIDAPTGATSTLMPINSVSVNISTTFVIWFAIFFLISTSTLGSMILGLIKDGKEKKGLRYTPFLVIISLIVFFVTRMLLKSMFSGLLGT